MKHLLLSLLITCFGICINAQTQSDECVRAAPKPIVIKKIFPKTTFVIKKNKAFPFELKGFETVNFKNGDKLVIENGGCENFTLIFRFETDRFSEKPADVKFWYQKSIQLMREMLSGIDAPIALRQGTNALASYLKKTSRPKFNQEIDFGGTEIRDTTSLVSVKKINQNRYKIELFFSTGPL
jgi:hypothetical protein